MAEGELGEEEKEKGAVKVFCKAVEQVLSNLYISSSILLTHPST